MRRATALIAAAAVLASSAAVARPMPQQGYYVVRWDDTGICQIWNTDLRDKPARVFSNYSVVSKPVPTFADAVHVQESLRWSHHCTL